MYLVRSLCLFVVIFTLELVRACLENTNDLCSERMKLKVHFTMASQSLDWIDHNVFFSLPTVSQGWKKLTIVPVRCYKIARVTVNDSFCCRLTWRCHWIVENPGLTCKHCESFYLMWYYFDLETLPSKYLRSIQKMIETLNAEYNLNVLSLPPYILNEVVLLSSYPLLPQHGKI